MAVSPTSGMPESDVGNEAERSATLGLGGREASGLRTCMLLVSVAITLVGLVGNGVVLWLLGFSIQRNPFSVYILNRTATDTLFLCCHMALSLSELVFGAHYFFIFPTVVASLRDVVSTLGLSLLAAVSTERCLSVCALPRLAPMPAAQAPGHRGLRCALGAVQPDLAGTDSCLFCYE
ncbi:mas-related G-protein coupled receptor member X2-like [Macrotis lagotis]|uniref:mas-related G-protein coupled receptor member X2-like n=1 Tax=Macrotis lagotis TaxID=92651 RepID=UPI003D696910